MKRAPHGPTQYSMKTEGEARIEGAKRPRIEGEARIEGAKRPSIEGKARIEGEVRDKSGGGVWGGGSVSPSPENFCKKTILKWCNLVNTLHRNCLIKQFNMP